MDFVRTKFVEQPFKLRNNDIEHLNSMLEKKKAAKKVARQRSSIYSTLKEA